VQLYICLLFMDVREAHHGHQASEHGRQGAALWASAVLVMDAPGGVMDAVSRSRRGRGSSGHDTEAHEVPHPGGGQPAPGRAVRAVRQAHGQGVASLPAFPHGHRGAVYCWLWDNHKEVLHAMERHWLTWDEIARAAARDGVKGRWDKPPTRNAMRRVWGRVCAEREARKVEGR